MLVFNKKITYTDALNIVFLCGSQYSSKPNEKRTILKSFLETTLTNTRVIILEENFIFAPTNKRYLSYDDIFLKSLAQVEQLASMYANKIIIIHETISTAAELGMFAINPLLAKKICLLTPDDISISENKISKFIQLAFMNSYDNTVNIGANITYYPDLKINRTSHEKSDYYTYFHNNQIGTNLGERICDFVKQEQHQKNIKFQRLQFNQISKSNDTFDYFIENNMILAYVSTDVIKAHLLSLFFQEDCRREFRKVKEIHEHVTYLSETYKMLILNTVADLEGLESTSYKLNIEVKDSICNFRQTIGYFIYMLQAIGFINLEKIEKTASKRKITISTSLDNCRESVQGFIINKKVTKFGRMTI